MTTVVDPAQLVANRIQIALAINHFLAIPAEQRLEWVNTVLADEAQVEQVDTDIEVILEMLGYEIEAGPQAVEAEPVQIGGYL